MNELPTNILFYDGTCGLCHHTVKFVLKHDREAVFRFSQLEGDLFKKTFSETERNSFPDSIVLLTDNRQVLIRSSATAYLLEKIGGIWRILSVLLKLIPRPMRDSAYIFVAKIRHKLFKTPDDVCPIVPDDLKKRFL